MESYIVNRENCRPRIWSLMEKRGILSCQALYDAIKPFIPPIKERHRDDEPPTQARLFNIITGRIRTWEKGGPYLEVIALSRLFDTDVASLFPTIPANVLARNADYKLEVRQNFKKAMREAGYSSYEQIWDNIVLNEKTECTYQKIKDLAYGIKSPIANGKFTSIAQEVATLLNRSPEQLFVCDPIKNITEEIGNLIYEPVIRRLVIDNGSAGNCLTGQWQLEQRKLPEDVAVASTIPLVVRDIIKTLPSEQEKVIIRFFGLDGDEEQTLETIAEELDVTRDAARGIHSRALNKLRAPKHARKLRTLYQALC